MFELKAHPVVDPQVRLAATFRAQRERLRGLAYRLTGSAEDAEDVVQEAFVRLMTQAPESVPEVGPWLARVATHLSIDALRRRRRRGYVGPWLPSPAPGAEGEGVEALAAEGPSPEARYGLAESATFAFLIALEVLSPRQRAVLVLRDVLGRSARETAALVDASEGGVRALHLRARRALDAYDASRCIPTPELRRRHRDVLERFLGRLLAQDVAGVESLLTESVETLTDSAGEFTALPAALAGRSRVARFYLAATRHRLKGGASTQLRLANGLPAAWITLARPVRRQAPRTLLWIELDGGDRIRQVQAILAPRKLALFEAS